MNILNLYLFTEVTNESVKPIIEKIIELNSLIASNDKVSKSVDVPQVINIYINSEGGSVLDAFALVDIILHSKISVNTYAVGLCCSASTLIYLAGRKRYAYKHTTFIFHSTSASIESANPQNIEEYDKWLKILNNWEIELYNNTTEYEWLESVLTKNIERRITAEDAKRLHIVTDIIE